MAHSPVMKSGPAMLRTVRQERDRGLLLRVGLRAKDRFESFIASGSIHGDPGIYDNEAFPWAARLEAGWRDIRAELDAVLPEAALGLRVEITLFAMFAVIMGGVTWVIYRGHAVADDLVETDKIGSFFFINLALLINQDLFLRRQQAKSE